MREIFQMKASNGAASVASKAAAAARGDEPEVKVIDEYKIRMKTETWNKLRLYLKGSTMSPSVIIEKLVDAYLEEPLVTQ
jgi:hypothetical protein